METAIVSCCSLGLAASCLLDFSWSWPTRVSEVRRLSGQLIFLVFSLIRCQVLFWVIMSLSLTGLETQRWSQDGFHPLHEPSYSLSGVLKSSTQSVDCLIKQYKFEIHITHTNIKSIIFSVFKDEFKRILRSDFWVENIKTNIFTLCYLYLFILLSFNLRHMYQLKITQFEQLCDLKTTQSYLKQILPKSCDR